MFFPVHAYRHRSPEKYSLYARSARRDTILTSVAVGMNVHAQVSLS